MSVGSIITFSVILILLVCMIVFMLEILIPLQVKFDMNGICRSYYFHVESKGSLDTQDEAQLITSLEALGLSSVSINVEGENRFGGLVTFTVTGQYQKNRLTNISLREDVNYTMTYERTCYVRKIKN